MVRRNSETMDRRLAEAKALAFICQQNYKQLESAAAANAAEVLKEFVIISDDEEIEEIVIKI